MVRHLGQAGVPRDHLVSIIRYTAFMKRFAIITPFALEKLYDNRALVYEINEHFRHETKLSAEHRADLTWKGLQIEIYGGKDDPYFYGLRENSEAEKLVYKRSERNFFNCSSIDDLITVLNAFGIGIELEGLTIAQLTNLIQAFSKEIFVGLHKNGFTGIVFERESRIISANRQMGEDRFLVITTGLASDLRLLKIHLAECAAKEQTLRPPRD